MPYYVYAIHQDHTNNRHYNAKPYEGRAEAEAFEQEMRKGCFPHDNYVVRLIVADNDAEAAAKADAMRPFPKMKPNK